MRFEKISNKQYLQDKMEVFIPYEDIKLPERATKNSAGYDIYSVTDFTLQPGGTINLPTGIKVELDDDKFLLILPRSGQGFKYKLQLYNTVGAIDQDYYNNKKNEGHIWIKIFNDSPEGKTLTINRGDAICQGIILPYYKVDGDNVDRERNGGFGSTSNNTPMTLRELHESKFNGYLDFLKQTNGVLYNETVDGQIYTLKILTPADLEKYFDYTVSSINTTQDDELRIIIHKNTISEPSESICHE